MIPLNSQSIQTIIRILDRDGASSRAGIAKETGLSKQAVSVAMATLEATGWVKEVGIAGGYQGRVATLYDINRGAAHVLAVVLGEATELALFDLAGRELDRTTLLWRGLDHLASVAGSLGRFAYAGLAVPGVVSPVTGMVSAVPALPELEGIALADHFAALVNTPAVIENDANAGALVAGDSRGCHVYLTIGQGVGMGILNDGKLLRGSTGAAGEAALLQVGGESVESRLSATALLQLYRSAGGTCGTIADALADPSPAGQALIRHAAGLVAEILVPVKALLDPEVVTIGGETGASAGFVQALAELTDLRIAAAVADPELQGAARLARSGLLSSTFSLVL